MRDFDRKVKKYKRFLKEHGIFKRAIHIHQYGEDFCNVRESIRKFPDCLLGHDPCNWIQNARAFCSWVNTNEGDCFWWSISLLWQLTICCDNSFSTGYLRESIVRCADSFFEYIRHCDYKCNVNERIINEINNKVKELKSYEKECESAF